MFCTKCGAPLEEGARFCINCGAGQVKKMRPAGEAGEKFKGTGQTAGTRTPKERRSSADRSGRPVQNRNTKRTSAPKKSPLLPVLIIVMIAALAALAVTILVATGKLDTDSFRFGKNRTETAAAKEKDDFSSKKKSENTKKEETAAEDSEEESESEDSLTDSSSEADSKVTAAASADSAESSIEKEPESVKDEEKAAEEAGEASEAASAAETPAIPEDFDSLQKALNTLSGAELDLVSSDVTEYPNVKLYFSYTDSAGEPITINDPVFGIKESIEGGEEIERKVRNIQQLEGNQGLSIDIVADKSGSMSGDLYTMQNIMSDFVSHMDFSVGDKAELIAFDSYIMYMCTYTQDPTLLQNGISNMTAHGDTALYDAIAAGITNASYQQGARCVIAFTDGADNRSTYTSEEIIHQSLEKEVPVYIIGLGGADGSTLSRICDETGGKYWSISSIGDMSEVMDEIYSSQKSMYCVEYESDKNADPYAERSVSCIVSDDELNGTASSDTFTAAEALKEQHHESRYELVRADVSWTEANDLSIAKGGHLATITSQEEQNTVSALAEKEGIKYVWIGGYTSVRNSTAYGHWVTGEPFDYTAWYPGEPSRSDSMDNEPEFYIMLWNVEGEWSWNDQRNVLAQDPDLPWFAGNMGYVIEYEN